MQEFCPLRSQPSALAEPVEWNVFYADAFEHFSDKTVNLTIHYQNAAGRAYFSHGVLTFEKGSAVPKVRLLDSGPQR